VDLRQRLQLIVDATTGKADGEFRKLTGTTRELGTAAERSASQVRAAADRVADARERERVAAGQLQVAERRLQELRDSGRARASQLLAAEEKAAAAQRSLQRAVAGTERALREEQEAVRGTADALEDSGRSAGLFAGASDRVRGALASAAGVGIGAFLRQTADGFAEGARSAQLFARSTNSSVEQAGQFLGLVGALGLDLNDLLEIQAEFAQKAADNAAELEGLGAQLVRNSDGTTNWTESLVSFLDKLQGVEDATERNRLGFAFLGEEGYKQLSRLVASGVDVRDALEQIGTPFTQADVDAAAEYDAAMLQLSLTGQRTTQALGRELLPAVTGLLGAFGSLVNVAGDIPGPIAAAAAAIVVLRLAKRSATVEGGRLAVALATAQAAAGRFRGAMAGAAGGATGAARGMAIARAGAGGLLGVMGGPLGLAIGAVGIGMSLLSTFTADQGEQAEATARANQDLADALRESGGVATENVRRQAATSAQQAGILDIAERAGVAQGEVTAALLEGGDALDAVREKLNAYADANTEVIGSSGESGEAFTEEGEAAIAARNALDDLAGTTRETAGAEAELAGELGQTTDKAALAEAAMSALTGAIDAGATSGEQFAGVVRTAAEAEAAQAASTDTAKAAIDAYNAVTRDAVETTLALYDAQLQQADGLIGLQQTIHDARDMVDDLSTPWNEVDEATNRVIGSTLDYASTSADAAVAAARAAGDVVDAQAEASIRGQETIRALYETLQQPGITAGARRQVRELIADLQEAQESGDVEAILRLTGAAETAGEIDEATADRDATVRVESRNGPAVDRYLDDLADQRLALIRTESRNGPAVRTYLDSLTDQRLALIRVESRNGPAVDRYLDQLATQERVAYIDVRERGTGSSGGGSPTGAMLRGAPATGALYGSGGGLTIQQLQMIVQADSTGRVTAQSLAEAGRQAVRAIGEYERRNGAGWRSGGRR
jgi:hypothetical protein